MIQLGANRIKLVQTISALFIRGSVGSLNNIVDNGGPGMFQRQWNEKKVTPVWGPRAIASLEEIYRVKDNCCDRQEKLGKESQG
ncbi:unnamed protein product [Bathycoccus prasinos]